MARQWTPEQRARQSKLIRTWRPWERSTGARTPEGKAIASRNAYKGGWRAQVRLLSALIHEQRNALVARNRAKPLHDPRDAPLELK